ncbi:MAG: GAF domain-containing protein [candidate division Zixibacteria bacterium]|nr:GAF domain-containing protein [candidate division Zixibacteria bacterium]
MYKLILDLAVVLFFLAFLFFILKQKERYFEYYPQSWRALMLGGILLVLAGGTNLALILNQGEYAFASQWQQIIRGIGIFGYVAGGALILFGLVKWWGSLVAVKRNANQRLRQLACLKSLLSVINHRSQPDEILKESLLHLMNVMGYKMGVIFKPTFRSSEMVLVARAGVSTGNLFTLYDLYFRNMWYKESKSSQKVTTTTDVKSLPEFGTLFSDQEEIRSFACVPIKFCGKVLGLMGLYDTKPDGFSYQEIQFLTSVGETLGLAAKQNLVSDRNKKRRDYISAVENMLKIVQETNSLEEAFPKISTQLKRIIDFDHISLALTAGSAQNMKRISIGSSGGMLVDRRAGVPTAGKVIGEVMRSGEVWIDRDIDLSESSSEDSLFKACGIKSRIILPLWSGDSICGALSLGHKKPNFYSVNDTKWLRLFTLTLSQVLLEQRLEQMLERKESLDRSLYEFDKKLAGEEDLKTLLEDATSSITLDLPKSFARVVLMSKKKDQLINCTARQIRSEGINLKKEERFSLDDLPWHRLTLEAKRPMLINQDDPESLMSKKEARLIMDEKVDSAFLVPLILNDKAVGIVSVGEMRSWDRQPFSREEMAFVKHKANQLCLALKKGILRRSNERLRERLKYSDEPKETVEIQRETDLWLSDLNYQINNPLTSIRGSAELLRLKESSLSPVSLKYLSNIENGVDRIQKTLEGFLNSTTSRRKSRSNQPIEQVVSG